MQRHPHLFALTNDEKESGMERRYYNIKLRQGLNEKWVKISAKSCTNASYEAEKKHRGWKAVDVQDG